LVHGCLEAFEFSFYLLPFEPKETGDVQDSPSIPFRFVFLVHFFYGREEPVLQEPSNELKSANPPDRQKL